MPIIYCNINMFTVNQDIAIVNGTSITKVSGITMDNLITSLPALCEEYGAETINLYGFKAFADQIAEEVSKIIKTKYSNKNITIEVNK